MKPVFTKLAFTFQYFASALARSMSNPVAFPLVVASSMGGNVGSLQYLNEPLTGDVTCCPAPAVPATVSTTTPTNRATAPM